MPQLRPVALACVLAAGLAATLLLRPDRSAVHWGVKGRVTFRRGGNEDYLEEYLARNNVVLAEYSNNSWLSDECLTYGERFAPMQGPPAEPWGPDALRDPAHATVVLVQLYNSLAFTADQTLALRALVRELSPHHHVFFTFNLKPPPAPGNATATAAERAAARAAYHAAAVAAAPAEFRRLLVPFDDEDILELYPDVYKGLPEGKGLYFTGYLAMAWFLHRRPQYAWAWNVEADVRYTGHWARLLNGALRYAADHADEAHVEVYHAMPGPEQRAQREANGGRPDFLTFGGLMHIFANYEEGKAMLRAYWHWQKAPEEEWLDFRPRATVMVTGWSRRMADLLHGYSAKGERANSEVFPTSAAYLSHFAIVDVPHRIWEGPQEDHSYEVCCFHNNFTLNLYRKWRAGGKCMPAALLHPVKPERLDPEEAIELGWTQAEEAKSAVDLTQMTFLGKA